MSFLSLQKGQSDFRTIAEIVKAIQVWKETKLGAAASQSTNEQSDTSNSANENEAFEQTSVNNEDYPLPEFWILTVDEAGQSAGFDV